MPQYAGEIILATDIIPVRYWKKTAQESVSASTTLQDDDDFVNIALAANRVYRVELYAFAFNTSTADIKIAWTIAGGAVQFSTRLCQGPSLNSTDVTGTAAAAITVGVVRSSVHNFTTAVSYGTDAAATSAIHEEGLIETTTSGLAGTVTVQWAQNASSVTATSLTAGSHLIITEVEAG